MKLNDAIVKRIEEICNEQRSNVCDIALKGGMSLSEFFDRDYFNEIEDD